MAHDGFLGGFPWPLAHALAAGAAPFDDPAPHALMGAGAAGGGHDAALGALVPSQSQSPSPSSLGIEATLMEQLASRLGVSVPSPPSSRYASCHSTPMGSPSKPATPCVLAGDAERVTTLSCFPASGGKLSRVASSQSLLREQALAPAPAPCLPGAVKQHGSDGSCSDGPCRKRKASKAKDVVTTAAPKSRETQTRAKKCKLASGAAHDDEEKPGEGWHGNGKGKEVVAEPPKDYIHVRARRGQATDSHSLAERVRREKISERMKLLQDLVPGCSKVTGKAVMLDEIINYVQSLQRQVEFLSMKLSTVNPRLELNVDSNIPKLCAPATSSMPQPLPAVYALEGSSSAFCYTSSPGTAAQSTVTNAKGFEMSSSFVNHGDADGSLEGLQNANANAQMDMGSLWEEGDLQSLVLMGFRGDT